MVDTMSSSVLVVLVVLVFMGTYRSVCPSPDFIRVREPPEFREVP